MIEPIGYYIYYLTYWRSILIFHIIANILFPNKMISFLITCDLGPSSYMLPFSLALKFNKTISKLNYRV
jgi:hypothetical protein